MLPPNQLQALLSELSTDPKGLGYAPNIAAGADGASAVLLNSLTGNGAGAVYMPAVPSQSFIAARQSAPDWTMLTTPGAIFNGIQLLSTMSPLDCTQSNTRTILTATFSGLSAASKAAMIAVAQRTGSRAQVLFGAGIVVSAEDVAKALGRGN
jgi:hypothetical protein